MYHHHCLKLYFLEKVIYPLENSRLAKTVLYTIRTDWMVHSVVSGVGNCSIVIQALLVASFRVSASD